MNKKIEKKIENLEKRVIALEESVQAQPMNIEMLATELEFYMSKTSHKTE